jgi:hypothetical protein
LIAANLVSKKSAARAVETGRRLDVQPPLRQAGQDQLTTC